MTEGFTILSIGLTVAYMGVTGLFLIGLLFRRSKRKCLDRPKVTVVVAARNEEEHLPECLQSLVEQDYPETLLEVIVVDDDSSDGTSRVVREFAGRRSYIRGLAVGDRFPDYAAKKRPMSVGIAASTGEIVLTTDADCTVPPTWVSGMVSHFAPDVGAVVGFSQVSRAMRPSFSERVQALDFLGLMAAAAGASNIGLPWAASGQNLGYRKALFDAVDGFSRIRHRPSGDDVLLLQLMRGVTDTRFVFVHSPDTFVQTVRTENWSSLIAQRSRWASNALPQWNLNRPFFLYLTVVFLANLMLPVWGLLGALSQGVGYLPWCAAAKVGADLALFSVGAWVFGRRDLIPAFPLWTILQPCYMVIVGLGGSLGRITWKGRHHQSPAAPDGAVRGTT